MNRIALLTAILGLVVGIFAGQLWTKDETSGDVAGDLGNGNEQAPQAERIRWKLASAFPSEMTLLGVQGKRFESRISTVSGGEIEMKFFDPGALVPALEIFDAVSAGSIDAGWSSSGYWAGKMPAAQIFNSVPFGPQFGELMAWMRYGGGQELFQELYHPHNVHPLVCFFVPQDGSGWFRDPIDTLEDFAGLKVRYLGLGARVLEKFGASTQILAGGDIFPALELGTIDAAEFSMPAIDLDLGLYQVAKHYYLPGWHQPANMGELIINLDRWKSLADRQKALIETTCGEALVDSIASGESAQSDALRELEQKGVTIHRWPPDMIKAFHDGWMQVAEETAATDPDFARMWQSLKDFRVKYDIWRTFGDMD